MYTFIQPKFSKPLFWRRNNEQSHVQGLFWHRQWVWNGQRCLPIKQVWFVSALLIAPPKSKQRLRDSQPWLPRGPLHCTLKSSLYLNIPLLYPVSTLFHTKRKLCLSMLFFYATVSTPLNNLLILPGMLSSLLMSLRTGSKSQAQCSQCTPRGSQRRISRVLETTFLLGQFKFIFTLGKTVFSGLLLGLLLTITWRWL